MVVYGNFACPLNSHSTVLYVLYVAALIHTVQ